MTSSPTAAASSPSRSPRNGNARTPYSLAQRIALTIVPSLAAVLVKLLGRTWRFEVIAEEGVVPVEFGQTAGPEIYCFWHQCVLPCTIYFRHSQANIIISQSFDGELVTRFLKLFGYGAARGSSSNQGREGLLGLKRVLDSGQTAIFTADGPRGPIYRTKMGPIKLAQMTGAPVGAFHLEPQRAWVLKSWDRFLIPKPFTRICVSWATWTHVPQDLRSEELESKREQLNAAIERARTRALQHLGKVV